MIDIERLAAFSNGDVGGNPAGVVVGDVGGVEAMQAIARDAGYSETAFAVPVGEGWRVRYFSPEAEVPFCGHATIALGAALAMRHGDGVFALALNDAAITVEGRCDGGKLSAALRSPPTRSAAESAADVAAALALFGLERSALDPRIPPARIHAGADHLVLALNDRRTLAAMTYDLTHGRTLMRRAGWITVMLVHAQADARFVARNAFAYGGVHEDPATGAAAAAFAGYLRDLGWPHGGAIAIDQGDDMGVPSRIRAQIGATPGDPIHVSGAVRLIASNE